MNEPTPEDLLEMPRWLLRAKEFLAETKRFPTGSVPHLLEMAVSDYEHERQRFEAAIEREILAAHQTPALSAIGALRQRIKNTLIQNIGDNRLGMASLGIEALAAIDSLLEMPAVKDEIELDDLHNGKPATF